MTRRRGRLWQRASRTGHDTQRRRPLLRWAYERTIALETGLADALHRNGTGPADPGNVTLVVKTFERPSVLRRMLRSVRRVYSGPIIVADDSSDPQTVDDPGVRVLALPFDSGIGVGRNVLLAAVDTEYVFMTDDDMHLMPDFDLAQQLAYLQRNPEVDLVGGRVIHLPLWRTADYSGARLYAYRGEPRRREGVVIDGLPVSYKVPNFYVGRTDRIRTVGYDDRLKRQDHNDFFTSAYGDLVCVIDRAMVCLHAHSFFDPHYQSFRMDVGADQAYLATKWAGSGSPTTTISQLATTTAELLPLHHAAVETVAQDLEVRIVHHGTPSDPAAAISVDDADRARLTDTLRTLGWSGHAKRLTHPLWGELHINTSASGTHAHASFATINGLTDSAEWPAPVTREGSTDADWIRWHPRAGWVDDGESLVGAALPLGPIQRLEFPADLIWEVIGPGGKSRATIAAEVLEAFDNPPPEATAQVEEFLNTLLRQGLLESLD